MATKSALISSLRTRARVNIGCSALASQRVFAEAPGVTRGSLLPVGARCDCRSYLEPRAGRGHLTSALLVNEEMGKLPRRSDTEDGLGGFTGRCQAWEDGYEGSQP